MNKLKLGLEQRVFVLYIILTFLLVLILAFSEWQLAKFGIWQFENKRINEIFQEYRSSRNRLINESQNFVNLLSTSRNLATAVSRKDSLEVRRLTEFYSNNQQPEFLAIYSSDYDLIYGENWELIENYLPAIFDHAETRPYNTFYTTFGKKIYRLTYSVIYNDTSGNEISGIVIRAEFQDSKLYQIYDSGYTYLFPYPLEMSGSLQLPSFIHNRFEKLKSEISRLTAAQNNNSISRLGPDLAVGIEIEYDLTVSPKAVFLLVYSRNVNVFAQQSVLIFILILLAVTIIMSTIMGSWFKAKILQPVNDVSNRMQEIANNPAKIEPLQKNYKGVLGDMVETFNSMNLSLDNYSRYLKEYKVITDELESGIFWLDKDFRIILCNPSLAKIFETEPDHNIIGDDFNKYIGLDPDQIEQAKTGSITIPNKEIRINQRKKYILLNIRSVHSGATKKLLGNITDITKEINAKIAKEAMELELIKSNRLAEIGRRVEGIVHNLNSPLNSLLGYAQLLKRDFSNHEDLDKIIEAGRNISHMVKGVLHKIKDDNSSMLRPLDINELIIQEMELCKHNLFFKHNVEFSMDLASSLPPVKAVYGDISLCLANIINNALETLANTEKKIISLKTAITPQNNISIEITDSGEGIPAANLDLIFKPYFTTKKNEYGSGFGLGLAISQNIVAKYNGKILVKSTPGQGSTFTIILPVELPYEN